MGLLKKRMRLHNPIYKAMDDKKKEKKSNQGYIDFGNQQRAQADLDAAMKDYEGIETNIRDTYTNAAKKAGTYANTSEFNSGLQSEIQAGVRGARANAVARINAMRKAMGNTEEFKPEGYDQTQANATADKLAAAPPKEDAAPEQEIDREDTGPQTANAAANVQNLARLAALKKAKV